MQDLRRTPPQGPRRRGRRLLRLPQMRWEAPGRWCLRSLPPPLPPRPRAEHSLAPAPGSPWGRQGVFVGTPRPVGSSVRAYAPPRRVRRLLLPRSWTLPLSLSLHPACNGKYVSVGPSQATHLAKTQGLFTEVRGRVVF